MSAYFIAIKICLYFGFAPFMFLVLSFVFFCFGPFVSFFEFRFKNILSSFVLIVFMPMTKCEATKQHNEHQVTK